MLEREDIWINGGQAIVEDRGSCCGALAQVTLTQDWVVAAGEVEHAGFVAYHPASRSPARL